MLPPRDIGLRPVHDYSAEAPSLLLALSFFFFYFFFFFLDILDVRTAGGKKWISAYRERKDRDVLVALDFLH